MRFMPAQKVDIAASASDPVFRVAGRGNLFIAVGFLFLGLIAAGIMSIPIVRGPVAIVVGVAAAILLLFALFAFASYHRMIDPAMWVCQVRSDKLLLRCSRRWSDRPPMPVQVLELEKQEVAWVRLVKVHTREDERASYGPPTGGVVHHWYHYLEMGLTPTGASALSAIEANPKLNDEMRTLLFPALFAPDQPVQRSKTGSIQVWWGDPISNVSPGDPILSKAFSQFSTMLPPTAERRDYFFPESSA